jgi:hypothetical protein
MFPPELVPVRIALKKTCGLKKSYGSCGDIYD